MENFLKWSTGPDGQLYFSSDDGYIYDFSRLPEPPQDPRDQYYIHGLRPEIVGEVLTRDEFDMHSGQYRPKGSPKYTDDDLRRLKDMENDDNPARLNLYRNSVLEGQDPMVAMSRAQMAEYAPIISVPIAYQEMKKSGKSLIDNVDRQNYIGAAADAGLATLSLLDMVGGVVPAYLGVKKGADSLIDYAIGAVQRRRGR